MDYFPALTGLRFVLAVWVMLHHISGKGMILASWADSLPPAAASLVRGGYLAVQTFFILSGFVLARTYAKSSWRPHDFRRYAMARIARIYPVYLLSLAVVSPFIYKTMLRPDRTPGEKFDLLASYGLVLQGWNGGMGVGWNTPAWSLSCEFFFYLCFPLLIAALRKANRATAAAVLGISLVVPVLLAHSSLPWEWKPIHHLSDFAAGIAAARLFDFARSAFARRGAWFYLPALCAGALLIIYPRLVDGTHGDLNTGLRPLNAIALLGLALGGGWVARVLSWGVTEYLGKVSYAMYILHVPVLWWYGHWSMHGPAHPSAGVAALLYFALVTAISALAYRYVEMPANAYLRRLGIPSSKSRLNSV